MEKKMTAEELMIFVESLENDERWKFLICMYNKYFNKDGSPIDEEDIDY